ncbi:MAG TPA: hypothetical protein VJT54_17460 [Verrucomicrobiae bacterium]|nr:hypothetical protein [Verrucomicrobiae bacterium]
MKQANIPVVCRPCEPASAAKKINPSRCLEQKCRRREEWDLVELQPALDQLQFVSPPSFRIFLTISSCRPEAFAGGVMAKMIEIGRCLISIRPSENRQERK